PKKLVVLKGYGHYEVYGGDAFRQGWRRRWRGMGRTYRRGESFLLARHGRRSAVRPQVHFGCAVFSVGFVLAIWAIATIHRVEHCPRDQVPGYNLPSQHSSGDGLPVRDELADEPF